MAVEPNRTSLCRVLGHREFVSCCPVYLQGSMHKSLLPVSARGHHPRLTLAGVATFHIHKPDAVYARSATV
jgi:hypothetical protein